MSCRYLSRRLVFKACQIPRKFSLDSTSNLYKGAIVGLHFADKEKADEDPPVAKRKLQPASRFGSSILDKSPSLQAQLTKFSSQLKVGKLKTYLEPANLEVYDVLVTVGCGSESAGVDQSELVDERKENIRTAVAASVVSLRNSDVFEADVDPCGDAEAAAEGAHLCQTYFQDFKSDKYKKKLVSVRPLSDEPDIKADWDRGQILAESQAFARHLMESPGNHMTPRVFAETVAERLRESSSQVICHVREEDWIANEGMRAFLSVSKGSTEPARFLEVHYVNEDPEQTQKSRPLVLVGKGVTFDSGGISIKPASNMAEMRADMGGAACVAATLHGLARLNAKGHFIGLMPLCENMPSGSANKPGDVVWSRSGKSIEIDNTDAEGRLLLADALDYADTFHPGAIVDVATLTGAMGVALGSAITGTFSTCDQLWTLLQQAGIESGDRVWRMPLLKAYSKLVTDSTLADCLNVSKVQRGGGACTAAAFLKEFVKCKHWMHLDIAGVMNNKDDIPYLPNGMTGRPTRTLIKFCQRFPTLELT